MAGLAFTSASAPISSKVFNGGLNSTAGPLGLKDNESSDLQNIDFDKYGSILKRNGYATLNTASVTGSTSSATANQCDGLYWYEFPTTAGATTRNALSVFGGKIYRMDDLDGTWDDISGAVSITSGNQFAYETFNKTLFATNGVNPPIQWAGIGTAVTATVVSGLTKAKCVCLFNNFLFYGNVTVSGTAYSSRIYWSAVRDPATWNAADWIEVAKDDGQEITGLKVLQDRLVIFKNRSIYNLYFTGDADVPFILPGGGKSNSAVGCVAQFSIQEVENSLVFLSYDGLYVYDGMNSYKISHQISNTFLDYGYSQLANARSLVYKTRNRYLLGIAGTDSTTNNRVILWDYFNNAFSIYVGLSISAMSTFFVDGVNERPYFGDYSGFVYRMDTTSTDNPKNIATAISAYYYTNWRYFDDLCDQKGIPHIYLYFRLNNTTLTLSYSYDFEAADTYSQSFSLATGLDVWDTMLWGTGEWAGSGGNLVRRDLTGRGRLVRFKFFNSITGETFRIDGIGTLAHLETNV